MNRLGIVLLTLYKCKENIEKEIINYTKQDEIDTTKLLKLKNELDEIQLNINEIDNFIERSKNTSLSPEQYDYKKYQYCIDNFALHEWIPAPKAICEICGSSEKLKRGIVYTINTRNNRLQYICTRCLKIIEEEKND